jgi:hypothetical protein
VTEGGLAVFDGEELRRVRGDGFAAENVRGADFRDADEGLFAGAKQYKFMRALFGLVASASIGIVVIITG